MRSVILAILMCGMAACAGADKPNILVILADDLGYNDVGFQGSTEIPTPHLDRLSAEGVRCTSGYVSHPFCSPTRAGLMTGRYQQRFGHEGNPAYDPADEVQGLPVAERTLPELLRASGYTTAGMGKWHLGAAPKFRPNARGFDEWYGFLGGGHMYFPGDKGGVEYTIPVCRNETPVAWTNYLTLELGREAAAFIRRGHEKPWFLYLAFNAPHTPLQAPPEYLERFGAVSNKNRRTYCAMVAAMDDAAGMALDALRESGQALNTLVFFLSDNGGLFMPEKGYTWSDNAPLRGSKGDVWEGGVRVPYVVRWPAGFKGGRTYDEPVSSLDIFATAMAVAGGEAAKDRPIDGVNLIPYLAGTRKGRPHDALYWRCRGPQGDVAVRSGDWKYLDRMKADGPELIRIGADIGETRNLLADEPRRAGGLKALLDEWRGELADPIPGLLGAVYNDRTRPL